ncbi:MAG: hypothetical protein C4583_16830 [Anaerolineaceae bacterium]|nr:MAG: hypothetical protein C4583_16830 [Anaerolineaceae bacterium]
MGLMIAYVVMYIITMAVIALRLSLPPVYGIFMLLCGLAAGIVGLIAITRQHERSWLVWLTLLPGAFVLFLLLGEFLVPLIFPELAH